MTSVSVSPFTIMRIAISFFIGMSFFVTSVLAAGPGKDNDFEGRRVMIIGLDGVRSDALRQAVGGDKPEVPNIAALIAKGMVTWNAVSGGELGTPTEQPTISGACWSSILTGTYTNKHGLVGNQTEPINAPGGYQLDKAPHFAKRMKEQKPESEISSFVSWGWINSYFMETQPELFAARGQGKGKDTAQKDIDVTNKVTTYLAANDPDVMFVHLGQVDSSGHKHGYRADLETYQNAIVNVDGHIGSIVKAIEARPRAAEEDWLYVLTTDHGGLEKKHGGQSPDERTIFLIVSGKDNPNGKVVDTEIGHHVVPAIVFRHLGLEPAPNWEPGIFGW